MIVRSELAGNEASSADTMSSQLVKNKEKVDKESTEDSVGSPGKYAALAKLKQEIREEATGKMPRYSYEHKMDTHYTHMSMCNTYTSILS